MKILKLLSIICSYIASASMLIWLVPYIKSPMTFVASKYEYLYYFGIIVPGLLSAILKVIYLILGKNYKELRLFLIQVMVMIVLVLFLIFVDYL